MGILPKQLPKITAAPKSADMADFRNRVLSFCQHLACHLQPVIFHIFRRRHMQTVLKKAEAANSSTEIFLP